jgi:glutamine synthetase
VDALPAYTAASTVAAFEKFGVLTKRELESREEIAFEQYVKTVNVEANLVLEIGKTIIFPAAIRYQGELADTAAKLKAAGVAADVEVLTKVTDLIKELQGALKKLEAAHGKETEGGVAAHAKHFLHEVIPAIVEVRIAADALEGLIADDLWPLPTYQEMLFIK